MAGPITTEPDSAPRGPLSGCRVLELGSTVAGPFCGRLMADFGAEVIKVEPLEGDAVRSMGKRHEGVSLYAASIFRNKDLIAVDLRTEQGRDIVRKLAADSDFLIENFRPGTMEKWGLGHDDLTKENPGLIMVRISGYGQDGPYAKRPGYGVTCEAVSGLRGITGDPDRPPPRVAVSLTDYITGLYGAFGAVMALHERHLTGRGQVVDAALYESAFSFMEPHVPAFAKLGIVAKRAGSKLPNNTPNNLYPTGDDRNIHIAAGADSIFARLAKAMAQPELTTDPRFSNAVQRSKNEDLIDEIVAKWTASQALEDIEAALEAADVPFARIYDMADIFEDPHYGARGMLRELDDPEIGSITLPGIVPRLSATPGSIRWTGHRVGQDTQTVLETKAGLTRDEIDRLQSAGIVACLNQDSASLGEEGQTDQAPKRTHNEPRRAPRGLRR